MRNHFGIATLERPSGTLIWIHAVSIGESIAALTFINHIKKQFPDLHILITTATVTSAEILHQKISKIKNCFHQFVVADNPSWIKKFIDHWQPSIAIFLESEIWPNLIENLHKRGIPIFLLNARLSYKSFSRWKYFSGFFAETLKKFEGILAQSEIDRERYAFFSPHNTFRIDNLKYANAVLPCDEKLLKQFESICAGKHVLVAASTHEGEEKIILEAHKKLNTEFKTGLITFIIPRHLTRIKRVCELITACNLPFALRSDCSEEHDIVAKNTTTIYCVDSFGEVGTFFRLADVCFVGGSLVKDIGGHNIYEPVALGKPVMHGPFMNNALEVRDFLRSNNVSFEVKNADDICQTCRNLFTNKEYANSISESALKITKNLSLNEIDEIMRIERFLL